MTLYEDLKAAGCQLDSHESDLYIRATDTAKRILRAHNRQASLFRSELDGKLWFDVPFAYDPFWENRGCTT